MLAPSDASRKPDVTRTSHESTRRNKTPPATTEPQTTRRLCPAGVTKGPSRRPVPHAGIWPACPAWNVPRFGFAAQTCRARLDRKSHCHSRACGCIHRMSACAVSSHANHSRFGTPDCVTDRNPLQQSVLQLPESLPFSRRLMRQPPSFVEPSGNGRRSSRCQCAGSRQPNVQS